MSTFKTQIPIDLDHIKKLLPPMSQVEGVTLVTGPTGTHVDIQWSNPRLVTLYSVPIDWPMQALKEKIQPDGVKVQEWPPKPKPHPEAKKAAAPGAKKPAICRRCGVVAVPTHFDNDLTFCSAKCHREHLDAKLARAGVPQAKPKRGKPAQIKPLEPATAE